MRSFDEIIWKEYQKKRQGIFKWNDFLSFLQKILGKGIKNSLPDIFQSFILVTDLVDDLMDDDNNTDLKFMQKELSSALQNVLNSLQKAVDKNCYESFIACISFSLLYQYKESQYSLHSDSKEEDYNELVKRSVYLMQSAAYLIDKNPSPLVLNGIHHFAISAQIDNDLSDLTKTRSFDLLDNKGTLPLLKSIDWAKENNKKDFLDDLISLNRNVRSDKYKSLLETIQQIGVIEYCQLISLYHRNKAGEYFIKQNPKEEKLIRNFIFLR